MRMNRPSRNSPPASMDAVQAIENQEKTVSRELHELRGALTETEGLHQSGCNGNTRRGVKAPDRSGTSGE